MTALWVVGLSWCVCCDNPDNGGTLPVDSSTFVDNRDNQIYKKVIIGGKIWMGQNLNYRPITGNSWCYENDNSMCNQYGRLYDWATAIGIDTSYNKTWWGGRGGGVIQGVCPFGWYLPSMQDWRGLLNAVGFYGAADKLKSRSGWYCIDGIGSDCNGTDDFKFSAIPGGSFTPRYYNIDSSFIEGSFSGVGTNTTWWTTTEDESNRTYVPVLSSGFGSVMDAQGLKSAGFSVRCIQDVR